MDNFTELLIAREQTGFNRIFQMISWLLVGLITIVISIILFKVNLFLVPFVLIILFALIYLNLNLINQMYIEFEYSLVNNYIDIDKIIGAKKRERMLSIKINDITEIGKYNNTPINREKYSHTITPVSSMQSDSLWYFIAEDEKGQTHFVLFEPDNRVLSHLKKFISRKITNGCLDEF